MAGTPFNVMGQYVASIQRSVIEVSQAQRSLFLPNGDIAVRGNIVLNGHSIVGAGQITVKTLNYTTLNPPVSSGGNMTGPLSSTDNGVVRYDGTTGQLVQDSAITISDDAKIQGPGGVVDFGTPGLLNITATSGIDVNGLPATASVSTTVVDSDIVVWNLTNGRLIKTSSIPVSTIATKLPLAGGTMSGAINMGGNGLTNVSSIAGTVKTSLANELLTSTASGVSDGEIVVFNSTTGKIAKASGVLIGAIATKLPLAGGTMSGAINMGGFSVTNVDAIAGSIKSSQVNDLVTSAAGIVVDSVLPVWSGTTGRVLKDSGIAATSLTIGAASSTDHAIARFNGITGKVIQNSTMTLSDDSKLSANGTTIDMSIASTLNIITTSAQINGSTIATGSTLTGYVQGPASAVNNNLAAYDLTSGKLIKDSGISSTSVVIGPASATNHAVARFNLTTGKLIQDSTVTISDDAKITGPGGTINMSTTGVIDISATSVTINGNGGVSSSSVGVTDSDIPVWNSTSGKLLKTSGVPISAIAAKLALSGGTMSGSIDMGGNNLTNVGSIAGTVKTSLANELLTSTASAVSDGEIVVFNSTTGKIAKASGVLIGAIAAKLPLAGGTMSGAINMGGFGITNAASIAGTVKTSQVNDLVTSNAGVVVDSNIPIWDSTTGRIIKDSGVAMSALTIGAVSSTDHALARFSGITGKVIQNSTMTLSDDAKLAASGGTIDMSTSGVINLVVGGSAQVNGSTIATASTLTGYVQGPASAVNNNLAAYDLTSGKLIKDSGILATSVVLGPASATNNAVPRFDLATGKLIKNSTVTISDDAKIAGTGGTIDLSTAGILDLQATSVRANGVSVLTTTSLANYVQGPASAVNNNLAAYDLTSGKLIKDSGVLTGNVVQASTTSTDRAIARFSGTTGRLVQNTAMTISDDSKISANSSTIDMSVLSAIDLQATSVTINGSAAAKVSDLATYVVGPGSAVNDNIATYNLTTGKLIKDSGVAIGQIANKLPLAGGTMSGNIDLGTNNLTNVGSISGNVKTSVVNDLITSSTGVVVDGTLPVWNSTTGRILKDSGIVATSLTIGAASSTDHALTRFSGITGKVIQNSTMTLSDDAKLAANSGTIDMSVSATINLVATSVLANGNAIITAGDVTGYVTGPVSAVNDNIATYNLTSGKLIKDSGVAIGQIANKLPLAGGTMSGSINMGGFSVTNVANIAGTSKTSAVNDIVTSSAGTVTDSNIVVWDSTTGRIVKDSGIAVASISGFLPLAGGTMTGAINMNGQNISSCGTLTFQQSRCSIGGSATANNSVAIGSQGTTATLQSSIAIGTGCTASSQNTVAIGNACVSSGSSSITIGGSNLGSTNSQTDGIAIGSNITLAAGNSGIAIGNGAGIGAVSNAIAIGTSASNSTASSFLFGNSAIVNIRPNNTATCDLGTTSARFKDLNMSGSIAGPTNSRTADNIVSCTGSSTVGRVATFSDTTGKVVQDGGTLLSDLATSASVSATYLAKAGGTMSGAIAMATNNITNVGTISGATNSRLADNIVSCAGTSTAGRVATFFDASGKVVQDGGTLLSDLATSASVSATYLAKAGGTMSGAIAMATNNITNIGSISGATKTSVVDSIVTSSALSAVDSDIAIFDSTTGKIIKGSSVQVSTIATKLPLAGGTMSGAIAMGGNNITNIGTISGATNSRSADNIVSCAGASVDGRVATFSGITGKIVQDGGTLLSSLATTASLSNYLPLAGGTMSGSITMGGNNLLTVGAITTSVNQIKFGNGNTVSGASSVFVGSSNSVGGSAGGSSIIYGANNNASGTTNGQSIIFGSSNTDSNASGGSFIFGFGNSNSTGSRNIMIGRNNTVPVGVDDAFAIGFNQTNSTTSSLLIGVGANIRTNPVGCDLGTTSERFGTLYLSGSISGPTNSRTADNIVSCTGTSTNGRVATFSGATGKVVQDSGTLLSDLATSASVSATYLPFSGGTMTGAIDMATNQINRVVKMSADPVNDNNVVWGTGTTLTTPGNNIRLVLFGFNNSVAGSGCVSIGDSNTQTVGVGSCLMMGNGNSIAGNVSSTFGVTNSITGNNSYTIGDNNTTTVSSGFVFGRNATNSTANSLIFGDTNVVNIRPNGNATCDLGTSAARFKDLYASGSLIGATGIDLPGSGTITVAGTNATQITLARATVPVICSGIFSMTVPYASWYSSTTYNPGFSAGVNRLTPPTSATTGTLVEFTYSLGVLTYTGTRTRSFRIEYDITWLAGASGANMIFFNSINASTVIGTQTQAREQVNAGIATIYRHTHFSDIISLATGNTVQLAGACAILTSAVAYQFVSCKISGEPN